MFNDKDLLLMSAARLYSIGLDLEGAREELRRLVSEKTAYNSPEMMEAYCNFAELKEQWEALEAEHLALKQAIKNAARGK